MKFPVCIQSVMESFDRHTQADTAWMKEFSRCLLETANNCFQDGLAGNKFIFRDEETAIRAWEIYSGETTTAEGREMLHTMIQFCRDAYQQGQESSNEDL